MGWQQNGAKLVSLGARGEANGLLAVINSTEERFESSPPQFITPDGKEGRGRKRGDPTFFLQSHRSEEHGQKGSTAYT